MVKTLFILCTLLCAFLFIKTGASADGFIIPIPPPDIERVPPLAIKYHRVSVEIDDQVARTRIDQVFLNDFHRELEGTYIFPLPRGANITEFAMYINGERISGELLERDKARQIYQDIVNRMKDPALLEYFDRDMFKIRVYPIPAHGEKRIQLEYSEILRSDAGLARYHYPLDTERFSSRPLQEVSVSVTLHTQNTLKTIYSPSHDVAIDRHADHQATISYEDARIVPDKDFILYYAVSDHDVGANVLTYKKTRSDGYFMLMLSPGYDVTQQQILPKDIVFVLDTSGSMRRDDKIQQARDALMYGLEGLNSEDRFGVVTFSTTVNVFDDVLRQGKTNLIQEAVKFVKDLRARGGTDIYEALSTALEFFETSDDSGRPRMIVFLTDGRPTVGLTEYTDILKRIRKQNTTGQRIFTFGVGYDVNAHLLDFLADDSKAASAYIEPREDLEVIVSAFFDKIDLPVLSDLKLKLSGAGVYDLFPKELPDLFKGSQLLLTGRYRQSGTFPLELSGSAHDVTKVFRYEVELPRSELANDFLPRIWAGRKVGYLLDHIRLNGETAELKEEVIELAKQFGIVTPYTSYLVTEDEEIEHSTVRPQPRPLFGGVSRRPDSASPSVDMYSLQPEEARAPRGFTESKEGEIAVRVSQDVKKLKEQDVVADSTSSQIRYIDTKTFYLVDEVWIDSAYQDGQETVDIVYGCAAYFALLDTVPEMAKFLSVGERLILCWSDQTCLKIGESGIHNADDPRLSTLLERIRNER